MVKFRTVLSANRARICRYRKLLHVSNHKRHGSNHCCVFVCIWANYFVFVRTLDGQISAVHRTRKPISTGYTQSTWMGVLLLIDVRAVIVPLLQPEPESWPDAETSPVLQDSTASVVNDGMSIYTWKLFAHCGRSRIVRTLGLGAEAPFHAVEGQRVLRRIDRHADGAQRPKRVHR